MNWLPVSLVAAHFVGDWFLQTRHMAENKSKDFMVLFVHVAIVFGTLALFLNPFVTPSNALWYACGLVIYGILHGIQDWYIWGFYGKMFPSADHIKNPWFFKTIALDQLIHLTLLQIIFQ